MSITYKIDERSGIILTTARGVLTEEDLINHKKSMASNPKLKPGMAELSDVRGVSRVDISPAGMKKLVAIDAAHSDLLKDYRLAIVASDDLVYGLGRMYEMMTAGNNPNVQVFRTFDEAMQWLARFPKNDSVLPDKNN